MPPTHRYKGYFTCTSKAFDKVLHESLIFKLKTYGVDGNLLENYLTERQQRVALNGQTYLWQSIYAGDPHGSVLGPLLFLIYIYNLPNGLTSMCKILADDTSLFSKLIDKNDSNSKLNFDLATISKWAFQKKMSFNPYPNKQAIEVRFSVAI